MTLGRLLLWVPVSSSAVTRFLELFWGWSEFICSNCLRWFPAQSRCSVTISYSLWFWAFSVYLSSLPSPLFPPDLRTRKVPDLFMFLAPTWYLLHCWEHGRHLINCSLESFDCKAICSHTVALEPGGNANLLLSSSTRLNYLSYPSSTLFYQFYLTLISHRP